MLWRMTLSKGLWRRHFTLPLCPHFPYASLPIPTDSSVNRDPVPTCWGLPCSQAWCCSLWVLTLIQRCVSPCGAAGIPSSSRDKVGTVFPGNMGPRGLT